jgi:hypothetical protein
MVVGQRHRLSYEAAREDAVADLDRPHARVPGLPSSLTSGLTTTSPRAHGGHAADIGPHPLAGLLLLTDHLIVNCTVT